jgi:hypothetical protein
MTNINGNISFTIIEESNSNNSNSENLFQLLDEFEIEGNNLNQDMFPYLINYNENYTVKELLLICDYYGITKEFKLNKCNKEQIIDMLVNFEANPLNCDIISKRKNMWFYINELKNDKFMKKYVLW